MKKLSEAEQKQTANKLKLLMQNPFYPSLRTKKVQGLDNVFEMSVNMDIRILWRYENGVIILLIDIGHIETLTKYQSKQHSLTWVLFLRSKEKFDMKLIIAENRRLPLQSQKRLISRVAVTDISKTV